MAHAGGPTAQANTTGPRTPLQSERQEQKRDLASWWKNFKRSDKKPEQPQVPLGIFGVPLQTSIRYANVAISLINDEGHSYIYGYVPIVVAKCGVFLKEKATETEGIFRLAGSEKRIKELKVAFDSPDRFGKGLDWTGYTVHDAANILRRYFNQLPEPIIPLDFYDRFRDPIRNHQAQAVGSIEAQSPSVGKFDPDAAIQEYQRLITEIPPLNRQLLLYILDLLAVFASKADQNKMTTPNLAAIFQPGILSHPQHDMAPPEYRLSQDVLIFLIENQDSFLIGMQGTAADAETVRDVQSGSPTRGPSTPPTPGRSKTIIGRSSSNASNRPESLRKTGDIRRNVSVSSKQSKRSENGPVAVAPGMSPSTSVHRSNTVPSRRDGSNAHSPRIAKEKGSDPSTPTAGGAAPVVDTSRSRQESLQSTPIAVAAPQFPPTQEVTSTSSGESSGVVGSDATKEIQTPKRDATPLLTAPTRGAEHSTERSTVQTPSTSPGRFLDIFKQSPTSPDEARKPNKLQKRRLPGTSLSSAQSSTHSLGEGEGQEGVQRSPAAATSEGTTESNAEKAGVATMAATAAVSAGIANEKSGDSLAPPTTQRNLSVENPLRPTISPSHSYRSATGSDTDMVGDDMPKDQAAPLEKEKRRHRWRLSRPHNKLDSSPAPSPNPLGAMTGKEQATSRSTVGSNGARKSFQEPTPLVASATDPATSGPVQGQTFSSSSTDPVFSDSEREKKGGLTSWFRGKMNRDKDRDAEKRASTPERSPEKRRSRQDLQGPSDALPIREQPPRASSEVPAQSSATASPGALAAAQTAALTTAAPLEESEGRTSTTVPPVTSPDNGATAESGQGVVEERATAAE